MAAIVIVEPETPEGRRRTGCGVEWESIGCRDAETWADTCNQDPPVRDAAKTPLTAVTTTSASAFTVLTMSRCSLVTYDEATARARERANFELAQWRSIEHTYWTGNRRNSPSLSTPEDAPVGAAPCTVLNSAQEPSTNQSVSLTAGVAALEDFAGRTYGGIPTLHAPRGIAAFASRDNQLVRATNGQLVTHLGSRWALGTGYGQANTSPSGLVAEPGTAWIYATGQVTIRLGQVDETKIVMRPETNQVEFLTERQVVVQHDCVCAAVLVNITCSC